MADEILKQAAIERSLDNLTVVIIAFDSLLEFLEDRPKPAQKLESQLFQIKEVESGTTSTIVQPTPSLVAKSSHLNSPPGLEEGGFSTVLQQLNQVDEVRAEIVPDEPPCKDPVASGANNKHRVENLAMQKAKSSPSAHSASLSRVAQNSRSKSPSQIVSNPTSGENSAQAFSRGSRNAHTSNASSPGIRQSKTVVE